MCCSFMGAFRRQTRDFQQLLLQLYKYSGERQLGGIFVNDSAIKTVSAVDKAREKWIFNLASQAELVMRKGGVQWKCKEL